MVDTAPTLSAVSPYSIGLKAEQERLKQPAEQFVLADRQGATQEEIDVMNAGLVAGGGSNSARDRVNQIWYRGMTEEQMVEAMTPPPDPKDLDQTKLDPAFDEKAVTEGDIKRNQAASSGSSEPTDNRLAQPPRQHEMISTTARPPRKEGAAATRESPPPHQTREGSTKSANR